MHKDYACTMIQYVSTCDYVILFLQFSSVIRVNVTEDNYSDKMSCNDVNYRTNKYLV